MKNLTIPTKLTQGASKEQLLIEKEMNQLITKNNRTAIIILILTFSIIGFPIALCFIPKAFKTHKRLRYLQGKLDKLIIKEASKN